MLDEGVYTSVTEISEAERIGKSYVSRILRLALLAPAIVGAILFGRNPPPGAAAKSVDMGDQGGMALGAWRSMRTRSTMPSWRCSA